MHYILVDYENVQPNLLEHVNDYTLEVTVFVGAHQKLKRDTDAAVRRMDERAESIKLSCTGPNALDFHLVFHLGQLVLSDPGASFEIMSHDKGYDPLIEHLKFKGISIVRTVGVSTKNKATPATENPTLPIHIEIAALHSSIRSLSALPHPSEKSLRKLRRNKARLKTLQCFYETNTPKQQTTRNEHLPRKHHSRPVKGKSDSTT